MDKLWVKRRPPTPLVWRRLETEFLAAAHGVVPLTSRVSTTKCNPWWNPACTKALQVKRARWKSYRRKRHTNSSEHHHILFKQASSQFSRIIKDAKAESVRRIRENAAKEAGDINGEGLISDQRQWNILDCRDALEKSTRNLRDRMKQLGENDHLVWDKDDADCLDFVTAYANFRAYIFNITMKTRFDVKSMAGNIIPAIATTNAIIAGLIVLEGMKILQGNTEQCKTVYLNRRPNPKKRLLVPCVLDKPNPKCYVCSEKPEVCVRLNVETITIHTLQEKILKNALNMVAPDVELADGKGTIIISSEPGETDSNNDKFLKDFNIRDGTQLNCDDFLQNYTLVVTILQCEKLEDGVEFEVIGDKDQLKAKEEEEAVANNINEDGAGSSLSATTIAKVDDEDDLICLDDMPKKRKAEEEGEQPSKKRHVSLDNDDVIVL